MRKILLLLFFSFLANARATDFSGVDSIIINAINKHYFPGAQLLIGSNLDIIYWNCYGHFTYNDSSTVVNKQHCFDLASLTKVVATTPAIMILYQRGQIKLEDKVIDYIPEFNNNGKENITILNLLLHNSGLKDWIPFYKTCKTREEVLNTIYGLNLEYPTGTKFLYSDLNFILLGVIVEKISGKTLDEFCNDELYAKLNMPATFFKPGNELLKYRILPTEYDSYWRNRQLQGEVHDEAASLLGGVSGNAGLFSNIFDLYKYVQVLLIRESSNPFLFDANTIDKFTTKYSDLPYKNTRALGWDTKPEPTKFRSPCGELISENCFGHTGYTGTSIWCDKDRNLIIIFLTNRVFPNRNNDGIKEVRPDLHNKIIQILNK